MQAHTPACMSAFYFHGDMHDVASLRIRTPKFETHDDAEEHYYEKRLEKYAARERRRIFYSVLVVIAVCTGMYRVYLEVNPQTWSQFLISFVTGGLSMILALIFCTKGMLWVWDIVQAWDDDGDDEDDNGKKDVAAANSNSMV